MKQHTSVAPSLRPGMDKDCIQSASVDASPSGSTRQGGGEYKGARTTTAHQENLPIWGGLPLPGPSTWAPTVDATAGVHAKHKGSHASPLHLSPQKQQCALGHGSTLVPAPHSGRTGQGGGRAECKTRSRPLGVLVAGMGGGALRQTRRTSSAMPGDRRQLTSDPGPARRGTMQTARCSRTG